MAVTLVDEVAGDHAPRVQPCPDTHGGGFEPPPIAVAMPWEDDAWALVLQPDSDLHSLASAVGRLPDGCRFVEAYGDVETVLVFRLAGSARTEGAPFDGRAAADGSELRPPDNAHPLALVRAARGWSYQSLSRLLAARARALGVNMAAERQKIWRWEHNGVTPHRAT